MFIIFPRLRRPVLFYLEIGKVIGKKFLDLGLWHHPYYTSEKLRPAMNILRFTV